LDAGADAAGEGGEMKRPTRLSSIAGFDIDRVAAAADERPDVLRLENLDTDLAPPAVALAAGREALDAGEGNSYLPFTGRRDLRETVAERLAAQVGGPFDPDTEVAITSGGTVGLLNALLATVDAGQEVVVTDPTYAGMINRIRLVGAVPSFVPFVAVDGAWRLDLDRLQAAVGPKTGALFIMSPSMPSGAVLNAQEWEAVASLCREHDLPLIYNAAMERLLYDDVPYIHPASLEGMRERTITVGSVSKEHRMIGWRVGWVAGPRSLLGDLATVTIYNGVVTSGFGQIAAAAALRGPDELESCVQTWGQRRDLIAAELEGLPLVKATGGWSMLVDARELGVEPQEFSASLMEQGVAMTPMSGWGEEVAPRMIRIVFSREPVERLHGIGERVRAALGQ
jgi:aspartate/methionine/tyrosine aminotransferase